MGQPNSKYDAQAQGRWEWKSNPNPFSQTEEAQWTPYKSLDNYLLERAYCQSQKEVHLGDYIVSIKDMLQKRKDKTHIQRPIRRNTEFSKKTITQEENIRAKRFFGAETPKTFNKAFGDLSDYLRFFQNRGPDIKEFAALFSDIESTNNLNLLNKIVQPCLINCLQNESIKIPETAQKQQQEKQLLQLFQGTVESLQQFFAHVLKAYTMESFLYRNLNSYLRNEDWAQLDPLLPYAYCLCKAFLRQEFTFSNPTSSPQSSMVVYRGAQFDETTLSFYDSNTTKNFCWNGVTSTSRNRQVSENFMYYNFDPKKVPVLFIIEVPLSSEITSTWIDIKPYSAISNEDEVVLPPGSVFELLNVSRNIQNTVEINLKLMTNVNKLAYQGQIMHGAMHSEMGKDTSLRLVCLEGRELSDAITHLKGNRLVEELEFCLCKFDDKVAAVPLEKIRRLKRLSFISSFAGNEAHWSVILKHLEKAPIEELEISDENFNDNVLFVLSPLIYSWTSLKSLSLTLGGSKNITDKRIENLCSQGLKYLTSLTSLTLNFEKCDRITDEGLKNFSFAGLISLTSLTLNFAECEQITDEGLKNFFFEFLISLKSLTLDFGGCRGITDEWVNYLSLKGLKLLTSLTSLTLKFCACYSVTDKGLNYLSSQGLKYLTSLTSLTLDLHGGSGITSEGFSYLSSQGLKYLTSLTSLTLNLNSCSDITDEGLKSLSSEGLKYLTSLTSLTLELGCCVGITNEGLSYLRIQGLKDLTSLRSLTLDIDSCPQITDEEIRNLNRFLKLYNPAASARNSERVERTSFVRNLKNTEKILDEGLPISINSIILKTKYDFRKFTENINIANSQEIFSGDKDFIARAIPCLRATSLTCLDLSFTWTTEMTNEDLKNLSSQGLGHLTSLTSLTLNFGRCDQITDEGLNSLGSEGLRNLTSLTELNLNFECCTQITDDGLKSLALKHLTSLKSLNLTFTGCFKITNDGLNYLSSQGLKDLTSLALNFDLCPQITDEGLKHLTSQTLKYLASLTCFALRLGGGEQITDEGLNYLGAQGLKYLTALKSLTLDFACSPQITDDALKNLNLKHLTSLTSLTLGFCGCSGLADEGLKNLSSQGLKDLTTLTSLAFHFSFSTGITDEGLNHLSSQGLESLASLTSLSLDFSFGKQITNKGLNYLSSQRLKYLTSLTSLTLGFGYCKQVTDVDLRNLSSQALKHLTSLTTLTLLFYACDGITNEGLNELASQGLKHLTSLTSLTLDFHAIDKVHLAAWNNFCKVLKYFGYEISKTP